MQSSTATEHVAASAEMESDGMDMQTVVTEWSQHATDEARELVYAAQTILTGSQKEVRDLCKPWGVQLRDKKRNRPMEPIKQELKRL